MKIIISLLVILAISQALAQIPIPNRYDGFAQGDPDSPILLEAFFDLLCPDSSAAWPNIKQVLNYYNPPGSATNMRFYLHTFPLPYHHNAFYAAQGLHIIGDQAPSSLWSYVDLLFTDQAQFYNSATSGDTADQVVINMATLVQKGINFPANSFILGMQNVSYDEAARVSWKYGCSRGVSGTPFFYVNGILVQADPEWTLADWRSVIDPLLPPGIRHSLCTSKRHPVFTVGGSCPSGTFECDYLPGKFQCCTPGEACVPNVGCRC